MINSLDHVNIRVADLRATLAFYEDVLGLRGKPLPGAVDMTAGAWIYSADGHPVLHVISDAAAVGLDGPGGGSGSGAIDHIAFQCADYDGLRARLASLDVPARFNDVPAFDLRQIFVTDPEGILVELNFSTPAQQPGA